ncbi:uncharacterized protein LOC135143811 [Zophobas morio]|uniref:uncharacterized protein LOC135143811 n=1 Tax=Zophobas morio TaxID=2755281 RepID=UPI003082DCF8
MPSSEALIRSRGGIKGKLTRVEGFVTDFNPDTQNINELETRLGYLEAAFRDFENTQLQIELVANDNSEDQTEERERFESQYFAVVLTIKTVIQELNERKDSKAEKRHQILESLYHTSRQTAVLKTPSANFGRAQNSRSNNYATTSTSNNAFLKLNAGERRRAVDRVNLCKNCLRNNHTLENCRSNLKCRVCSQNHNTIDNQVSLPEQLETESLNSYSQIDTSKSGILSTAIILIKDKNNKFHECRAFLDSGSMNNFITLRMCKKLGLPCQKIEMQIGGINQSLSSVNHSTQVSVKSRYNQYSQNIRCLVLSNITENLPINPMDMSTISFPKKIKLADPDFDRPGPIDLLIGAELFLPLMCIGQIHVVSGQPHFQKTQLGWIVGGNLNASGNKPRALCHFTRSDHKLHDQVSKLFELEDIKLVTDKVTPEERQCEIHFSQTIKQDVQEGRFVARLPFKCTPSDLENSQQGAFNRFRFSENKMQRQSGFKEQYSEFMAEYQKMNHMELIPDPNIDLENSYYLPHHAVSKLSSTTAKLRTVFDASFKTTTCKSLNDNLVIGPVIQEDLFSILTRIRIHPFVVTADIAKMYRQIRIDPRDTDYQRILWRKEPDDELLTYRLTTLTYGTKPASFIATRCLSELATRNQDLYPAANRIIKRDFYMDDLFTSAQTASELITLREEMSTILKEEGFELRKWASNLPAVLPTADNSHGSLVKLDDGELTKILGLLWDPKIDVLRYGVKPINVKSKVTKRIILSTIAQIFDPLGLIGAVILKAKLILQKLWSLKIEWDESVPQDIYYVWSEFIKELLYLRELHIPRRISDLNEIIGF